MAERQQNRSQFENALFREIHKNTWLRKVSSSNAKKKKEKSWVVFCIHDDTDAFLESYVDNKIAVMHKPDWCISLNNIQHISPTICSHEQEYEFVLIFSSEVIRLAASSWEQMLDWVSSLRRKLNEMRILSPKENIYTKLPESKGQFLLPTRDPTSPLPLPPAVPPILVPGTEFRNLEQNDNNLRNQRSSSSQSSNSSRENSASIQSQSAATTISDVFTFDNVSIINVVSNDVSSHYEHLCVTQENPGPSNRIVEVQRNARILQPPPLPYKTLREQQVLDLQREMNHPGGVKLQLRRKDCLNSIALVDAFDSVWVCGWKQKEHPMPYNVLHIGDEIISIEGIKVKSSSEVQNILHSHYCGLYINIVLKRVPHGQVFVIHRENEGQTLGIIQQNNTAVISEIELNSLAARHGLSDQARTCVGAGLTNWVLTEINGRPLNLFFKKNEVKDRLNSVGRDISILVQPLDLIKELKKHLKSLRNYKDYLLE